jgi:DNA-binding transcriptional ArsR family regulator
VTAGSGEPRLARIASAIADPTRARTLARLLDGRMHTAGELAAHAGVAAATMSGHLRLLLDEGLARVRQQGRHRYYGLADAAVAHALEALLQLADGLAPAPMGELERWQRPALRGLRHARSCYGHLAGELGVRLHEALLARGWVQATGLAGQPYGFSEAGRAGLAALGLGPLPTGAGGRALYDCMDWSERRDHFAGPAAVGLLDAFIDKGWLRRVEGSRELAVTPTGRLALLDGLLRQD